MQIALCKMTALPVSNALSIASTSELMSWLVANHTSSSGVWLKVPKKANGVNAAVSWTDVVDCCLCFGWIDSAVRKLDDASYLQYISPRKAKSNWSAVNKAKVDALIASGRMTASGMKMVELAKASGTWNALNSATALEVPDDLKAAFKRHPASAGHWSSFPPSARRGILEWISQAKTEGTRAKRVEETARLAGKNERALARKAT